MLLHAGLRILLQEAPVLGAQSHGAACRVVTCFTVSFMGGAAAAASGRHATLLPPWGC